MRSSRRTVLTTFSALTLAAAAALAGCGAGSSSSSAASAPADASDTSVSTSSLSGELTVFAAASLQDAFEELAEDFKTSHPDVSITFDFQGLRTWSPRWPRAAPPTCSPPPTAPP